ncbi:MAG: DUF3194 domain-containing protein [Euryarchaeota archaeon]|nr:DUF3194 domain-containing protein [Euryarchaeota archaeon]
MRKLTAIELDELSTAAAQAAQDHILSMVSKKEVIDLDIYVELTFNDALDVDVTVELFLDDLSTVNPEKLADGAVEHAILIIDRFMDD